MFSKSIYIYIQILFVSFDLPILLAQIEGSHELFKLDWHIRCKLQPNGYDCTRNESMSHRFYYDLKMNACKTFQYGLCELQFNGFHSLRECSSTCEVIGHQFLTEEDQAKVSDDTICRLQYDFGSCNNYYPMWYFDVTERTCKSFSYSGCGGNNNRFATPGMCNTKCQTAVGDYKIVKTIKKSL
ncbi:unnamed protein product [Spodoptera littoralis]|uniref:BPTI/Kunitz inhibitor domain-containing protein n=1 Tax=Spodoptera littoralis TaxID=7109 RepID=A0A9P0IJ79_SPOLI|nr:unnamed protein product [Spodoptera littoralis]CAH1647706.1 unnamed protein product [Spodoptera littoralis]